MSFQPVLPGAVIQQGRPRFDNPFHVSFVNGRGAPFTALRLAHIHGRGKFPTPSSRRALNLKTAVEMAAKDHKEHKENRIQ
jgi:hypothetical protein